MTHYPVKNRPGHLILTVLLTALPHFGFADKEVIWQPKSLGIREPEILHIDIHPTQPHLLFAATSKGLYRSTNSGKDFEFVLRPHGSQARVNDVFASRENPDVVWAATDSGVYQSRDLGRRWEQIFYSMDPLARRCQSVVVDDGTVYIGTLRGLFYRRGDSAVWQRGKDVLDQDAVFKAARDEYYLYFTTADDVYRWDRETSVLDRVFLLNQPKETESQEVLEDEALQEPAVFIKDIQVLPTLLPQIYLLTSKGLFHSTDYGENWEEQRIDSVEWDDATSLVAAIQAGTSELIIGTRHGVLLWDGAKTAALYKGMEATAINALENDGLGNTYAATDKGVFFLQKGRDLPSLDIENYAYARAGFAEEPSIRDVHRLAVSYAEVDHNKIQQWRRAAKHRAALPTLSVGLDRAATDYFHWDTGSNPDTLVKGRDLLEWDVSLSWDLGDLIWNSDQTSIDSRSKLMVELREDILDQVTRLYFERRRLQVELLALGNSQDQQLLLDKQMRLEELTALLDGFTGGEFSRQIESRQSQFYKVTGSQSPKPQSHNITR